MKRAFMMAASVTVLLAAAPAGAVDLIVFAATGGDMKPGQAVDGTKPVSLKAGQTLTLMMPDGRMIKLDGPYDRPPTGEGAPEGTNVLDAIKTLVVPRANDKATLGVMRDSHIAENGGEENLPDAWLVDVSRSGPRCVLEGRRVVLWRADDAKEQPVEIATADGSWRAGTKWPARSRRLAPPDKMPLTDGGKLTVRVGDAKADIDVTIIPASVKDATVQAAWMAEKGCRPQAVALLGKAR